MSLRGGDRLTPFLAKVRDLLMGRKYNNVLRYADSSSKKTQPLAFLPHSKNSDISENYYYSRDDRRNAKRPDVFYIDNIKLITDSSR